MREARVLCINIKQGMNPIDKIQINLPRILIMHISDFPVHLKQTNHPRAQTTMR